MSTPIEPTQVGPTAPPTGAAAKAAQGRNETQGVSPPVYVDTLPASPPAEVLAQAAAAASYFDQLQANGYNLRIFDSGALFEGPAGATRTLTLAELVRVASGEEQLTR